MTEKKSSPYHIFKRYLRPGVSDWLEKSDKEALTDDAPEIARDAFRQYVRKQNERIRKGMIS